jgi:hypothetical protein
VPRECLTLKCGVHLAQDSQLQSGSHNTLRGTSSNFSHSHRMAQLDEEDDYMNMVFEDAPKGPKYETSLQRAARKRKEVRLAAASTYS